MNLALMADEVRSGIESGKHERDYRVLPQPGEVRWLRSSRKFTRMPAAPPCA